MRDIEKCICILQHAIPHLLNIPGENPVVHIHEERERERKKGSPGGNMYISRYLSGEEAIRKRRLETLDSGADPEQPLWFCYYVGWIDMGERKGKGN